MMGVIRRNLKLIVSLALAVGIVIAFAVQQYRLHRAQVAKFTADTTLANTRARFDTTRRDLVAVGDSALARHQRLAFQREVTLRGALQDERATKANATARIAVLEDSLQAEREGSRPVVGAVDDSIVLYVTDTLNAADSLGVTIAAEVEVRGLPMVPPDLVLGSQWRWSVRREALVLDLSLTCRDTDAVATLVGARWARIDLQNVVQDPVMCNPPPLSGGWTIPGFKVRVPSGVVFGGGVLAGFALCKWIVCGSGT